MRKKNSKTPEMLGKGASKDLIASEAANSAVPAVAMIALLAFGIPGGAPTAVMPPVFYVPNVFPGPQLFQNDLEFVLAPLALNVMVLVSTFSTNMLTRMFALPTRLIGVTILLLGLVSVYSLHNSITDSAIAECFGVIFKRLNLPIVPIILGMVLGGIMETKLRSAMRCVKTALILIERPIAEIFAMIVIVIALNIRVVIRQAARPRKT